MREVFGELRSLLSSVPNISNFHKIIAILEDSDVDIAREQLIPYCMDKLKHWPDEVRELGFFPQNEDICQLYKKLNIDSILPYSENKKIVEHPYLTNITRLSFSNCEVATIKLFFLYDIIEKFSNVSELDIVSENRQFPVRALHHFCTLYEKIDTVRLYNYKTYEKEDSFNIRLNGNESNVKTLFINHCDTNAMEKFRHYATFEKVTELTITTSFKLYELGSIDCCSHVETINLLNYAEHHVNRSFFENHFLGLKNVKTNMKPHYENIDMLKRKASDKHHFSAFFGNKVLEAFETIKFSQLD